jgi:hypothetical protein
MSFRKDKLTGDVKFHLGPATDKRMFSHNNLLKYILDILLDLYSPFLAKNSFPD